MKEIQSKDNKIVKLCKKLQTKKYRDREGLYVIEGPNLLEEAVKSGAVIKYILVSDKYGDAAGFLNFSHNLYVLSQEIFAKIADTKNSQGVIAIVEKKHYSEDDLVSKVTSRGNIVVLDNLQDPGNMGTIIRTADAAGYEAVVVINGSCDVFGTKVVRAATGSLFRIPIIYTDYSVCIDKIKKLNKEIVVTDLAATRHYYDEDLSSGIALVIGNEGNGVSQQMKDAAGKLIKIPMKGNTESLNASVAAAIIMYEAIRK